MIDGQVDRELDRAVKQKQRWRALTLATVSALLRPHRVWRWQRIGRVWTGRQT